MSTPEYQLVRKIKSVAVIAKWLTRWRLIMNDSEIEDSDIEELARKGKYYGMPDYSIEALVRQNNAPKFIQAVRRQKERWSLRNEKRFIFVGGMFTGAFALSLIESLLYG